MALEGFLLQGKAFSPASYNLFLDFSTCSGEY